VAILFSQGPVQAVVVQQLHQQMAQLQEVIIGLGMVPVLAEDVLQVQAAVLLNVEASFSILVRSRPTWSRGR